MRNTTAAATTGGASYITLGVLGLIVCTLCFGVFWLLSKALGSTN